MKRYGVIMAGGGGTRFWPLSRQRTPKQLLNLSGKECMVNEAIDRLLRVSDREDMFVVTNVSQADAMKEVTGGRLLEDHILTEPAGRNTAACIGYAAFEIMRKYGDGIMIITPSDAYIRDEQEFARVLETAAKAAEDTDRLVTIGITPTFPATGYGYIKFDRSEQGEVKKVQEFREKPDQETARAYVDSGTYAWNSGMFLWKASVILDKFKEFLPEIYRDLEEIADAFGTPKENEVLNKIYPDIASISIDYGIMEKSAEVLVVPGEFGWNDVGSWDMMNVLHPENADGNIFLGEQLCIDTTNTTICSGKKLVAAIGVDNLVIVETDDVLLVCKKDQVQDVKKLVEQLKKDGREELL